MESRNTFEDSGIELFVDQEVTARDDLVDMSERARECASLLVEAKAPFVYGVCGPWGAGKSSFLGMVAAELQKRKELKLKQKTQDDGSRIPFIIRFNAWKYAYAEDIVLAFLFNFARTSKCIIPSSQTDVRKELEDLRGAIVNLVCLLGEEGIGKVPLVGLLCKAFSEVVKEREKAFKLLDTESTYDRVRKALGKLVRDINACGYRVIVLVDEIDRCLPLDVVRLMDGIRIYLPIAPSEDSSESTKEDIIYVITMDEDYVALAYKAIHNIRLVDAYEYLEKFIQFKYHIFTLDVSKVVANILHKYKSFPEIHQSERMLVSQMEQLGSISIRRTKAITLYYAEWLRRWVYEKTDTNKIVVQTPLKKRVGMFARDKRFWLLLKSYLCEMAMIKVCTAHHYNRIAFRGSQANLVELDQTLGKILQNGAADTISPRNTRIRPVLEAMGLGTDSNDLLEMAANLNSYRRRDDQLRDCVEDHELCDTVIEALEYLVAR